MLYKEKQPKQKQQKVAQGSSLSLLSLKSDYLLHN